MNGSESGRRAARRQVLRWLAVGALRAGACAGVSGRADAAAQSVEIFDQRTWARLREQLPRPSIVVFTATWCPNCPEVIDGLARMARSAVRPIPLYVVVMDGEGRRDLLSNEHFRLGDRVFAFRGREAAVRHSVDPRWRGVTPYVGLMPAQGDLQWHEGTPPDDAMIALGARL